MTLREKFNDLVPIEFGGMQEPLLTNCEQTADDFAIDFAEWCLNYFPEKIVTSKQLLEIFKKEKGL
jgi:hypothetical protein